MFKKKVQACQVVEWDIQQDPSARDRKTDPWAEEEGKALEPKAHSTDQHLKMFKKMPILQVVYHAGIPFVLLAQNLAR